MINTYLQLSLFLFTMYLRKSFNKCLGCLAMKSYICIYQQFILVEACWLIRNLIGYLHLELNHTYMFISFGFMVNQIKIVQNCYISPEWIARELKLIYFGVSKRPELVRQITSRRYQCGRLLGEDCLLTSIESCNRGCYCVVSSPSQTLSCWRFHDKYFSRLQLPSW